jgi:hypothetical protein
MGFWAFNRFNIFGAATNQNPKSTNTGGAYPSSGDALIIP